jgi:hypothetical protein
MSGQGWAVLVIVALTSVALLRRFTGKRGGCCGEACACGKNKAAPGQGPLGKKLDQD